MHERKEREKRYVTVNFTKEVRWRWKKGGGHFLTHIAGGLRVLLRKLLFTLVTGYSSVVSVCVCWKTLCNGHSFV